MAPLPHSLCQHLLYFLLIPISRLTLVTASGCYYADNSTVSPSPDYVEPCGTTTSATAPFLNCCALQFNNICLSSSLCYDPNQVTYYISPCTDQTYSAPECPQYCSNRVDMNQLDVTYDTQDQLWRCCGTNTDGSSNCSILTDEAFAAPPPYSLSTIYPITSSASSSSSSSPPPSSSSSSSPSTSSSSTPSSAAPAATESPIAGSTATTSPLSSTASTTTTIPSPTNSVGNGGGGGAGGQGLDTSDKLAIILALVIGLPGTIGTIVGAWYASVAVKKQTPEAGDMSYLSLLIDVT